MKRVLTKKAGRNKIQDVDNENYDENFSEEEAQLLIDVLRAYSKYSYDMPFPTPLLQRFFVNFLFAGKNQNLFVQIVQTSLISTSFRYNFL